METVQERARRVERLEQGRASRRSDPAPPRAPSAAQGAPGPPTRPLAAVELAPGRGDLTRSSIPFDPTTFLSGVAGTATSRGLMTVDGKTISFANLFATQPWVAAAVMRMLTWAVRVPLKVYRQVDDDNRVRLRSRDHALAAAIETPWEGGYAAALTMALLGPVLVHGNSLTGVDEGRSGKIEFRPKDYRYVEPKTLMGGQLYRSGSQVAGWTVKGDSGSDDETLSSDEALHCAWWSPLGPLGVSPLQQLGVTLSVEDAAQRYQRALMKNGARPGAAITATEEFLTLDETVRDALLDQLRDDVTRLFAGPDNSGRPVLLPPGLDWKPASQTAVEVELIDQRYITRDEMAGVYMIPPPSLGDLRRATYSNITELRQVAYSDGLGPPLVIVEQIITAGILRRMLREDDTFVEFDFAGVLRGDFLKEINALRLAIGSALLTPNEGRAVLNRPRSAGAGMDDFFLPFNNLAPIGTPPKSQQQAQQRGAERLILPARLEREREAAMLAERRARQDNHEEDLEHAGA